MSLPSEYQTPESYFRSCVAFLHEHAWIYKNANTCLLKANILENFTLEQINYFSTLETDELNEFPFVKNNTDITKKISRNAPQTLLAFREQLSQLTPQAAFDEAVVAGATASLPFNTFGKVKLKKEHEICQLADVIMDLCAKDELLIDVGSGLGYLSQLLHQLNPHYRILGLESDAERVKTAQQRQERTIPEAKESLVYKTSMITENSIGFIAESANEMLHGECANARSWSIIGLHACADLSVTAIRLFFELNAVRRLIVMPCCYHKMELRTDQTHAFRNFPLSESLRAAVAAAPPSHTYFNRPFLRLACQQTLARWRDCSAEEHAAHGMEMWQRALAEEIIDPFTEKVEKVKHLPRLPLYNRVNASDILSFENMCATYKLHSKLEYSCILEWRQQHKHRFDELQRKYGSRGAKLAEALTCLQTTMQKLCENIVLYDRLCFMQEYACSKNIKLAVRYAKITDEKLSPRCHVLIAEKL